MAFYTVNGSTCNIAVWIQIITMPVIDRIVVHGSGCRIAETKSTIPFAIRIGIHLSPQKYSARLGDFVPRYQTKECYSLAWPL